jgi:pyruvate-formate lyase-activating enzyme
MQTKATNKKESAKNTNNNVEIPFLKNIGLMQTFKCTITCPHCIVEAGPHRKEEMPLEDSLAWLDQARRYRDGYIEGLALTGGEPFYNMELLKEVANYGRETGFMVSVVTSAFWATSREEALVVLKRFPAIRMLCISTDEFHQKFIPFENIKNAAYAAEKCDIVYSFAICTPNFEDPEYLKIMKEISDITGGDKRKVRISITFPVGRAEKRSKDFEYKITSKPPPGACQMACSPIVFPDGKVMGCIGPVIKLNTYHPLLLGNLRENSLAEILDKAELNTTLHAIRIWGPHKIISLLKERGKESLLPEEYIDDCNCDICFKMFGNDKILDFLAEFQEEDEEFQQKVAYGRLYYLNETRMLEVLNYS